MIDNRESDGFDPEIEGWTPKAVKTRLVAATRWAKHYGGPVGPAGIKSAMPAYKASFDDHMDEGWGIPEIADDDGREDKGRPLPPSAAEVGAHLDALTWVAQFVAGSHPDSARVLALWVRCRVYRRDFDRAIPSLGGYSRSHAYRLRDRALSLISVALSKRGGGA